MSRKKLAKEFGDILYSYGTEDMNKKLCALLGEEVAAHARRLILKGKIDELNKLEFKENIYGTYKRGSPTFTFPERIDALTKELEELEET
jgi:hypothetical protein